MPSQSLALICTFCGCAIFVNRDPDSACYLDIGCAGCTAMWEGSTGELISAPFTLTSRRDPGWPPA